MARKALQRSTVTLQAQIFAHHENIFQLQMRFVPNFRRLYQSLQLYWHFKQSVDATSTLPLTNTDTHTLSHKPSLYTYRSKYHCILSGWNFLLAAMQSYEVFKIDLWNGKAVCVQRKHTNIYLCLCLQIRASQSNIANVMPGTSQWVPSTARQALKYPF